MAGPSFPGDTSDWLSVVNFYRGSAGLPPVVEDSSHSAGDVQAAQYMVANQRLTHFEDPTLASYSAAGDLAARSSDLAAGYSQRSNRGYIEGWMSAPFHALQILSPFCHHRRLRQVRRR